MGLFDPRPWWGCCCLCLFVFAGSWRSDLAPLAQPTWLISLTTMIQLLSPATPYLKAIWLSRVSTGGPVVGPVCVWHSWQGFNPSCLQPSPPLAWLPKWSVCAGMQLPGCNLFQPFFQTGDCLRTRHACAHAFHDRAHAHALHDCTHALHDRTHALHHHAHALHDCVQVSDGLKTR